MPKVTSFIDKISLGFVLVIFWIFMFINAEQFFPLNTDRFRIIMLTYISMTSLLFGFNALATERTERVLFKVSFLKEAPKFIISALISGVLFFLLSRVFTGSFLGSISEALSSVGIGILLLQGLFVATLEEKAFRGWVVNELRARDIEESKVWIIQAILFSAFHWGVSGSLLSTAVYLPLGFLFMYVKTKFSPVTDMANAGVHFSWNMFALGFFNSLFA
jgi:membrane protease YdiL (CAAX protease family)